MSLCLRTCCALAVSYYYNKYTLKKLTDYFVPVLSLVMVAVAIVIVRVELSASASAAVVVVVATSKRGCNATRKESSLAALLCLLAHGWVRVSCEVMKIVLGVAECK